MSENTMREAFEKDFPNWQGENTATYWQARSQLSTNTDGSDNG